MSLKIQNKSYSHVRHQQASGIKPIKTGTLFVERLLPVQHTSAPPSGAVSATVTFGSGGGGLVFGDDDDVRKSIFSWKCGDKRVTDSTKRERERLPTKEREE